MAVATSHRAIGIGATTVGSHPRLRNGVSVISHSFLSLTCCSHARLVWSGVMAHPRRLHSVSMRIEASQWRRWAQHSRSTARCNMRGFAPSGATLFPLRPAAVRRGSSPGPRLRLARAPPGRPPAAPPLCVMLAARAAQRGLSLCSGVVHSTATEASAVIGPRFSVQLKVFIVRWVQPYPERQLRVRSCPGLLWPGAITIVSNLTLCLTLLRVSPLRSHAVRDDWRAHAHARLLKQTIASQSKRVIRPLLRNRPLSSGWPPYMPQNAKSCWGGFATLNSSLGVGNPCSSTPLISEAPATVAGTTPPTALEIAQQIDRIAKASRCHPTTLRARTAVTR